MSRNLCDTACRICGDEAKLDGPARPIAKFDAGGYFDNYAGKLIVADARCSNCDAKYLAWVSVVPRTSMDSGHWKKYGDHDDRPFVDLSFRRAFNDEPAPEDLPSPETLQRIALREHNVRAAEMQDAIGKAQQELAAFLAAPVTSYWESYRR